MAKTSSKKVPTPESQYVAFIDILGFSEMVDENLMDTRKTSDLVNLVRNVVDEAIHLKEVMFQDLGSNLLFVSDSIIISAKDNGNNFDSFFRLLALVGYLQARCILNGIYLRGGVSRGLHLEERGSRYSILLSRGLVNAVEIEKSYAIYPRIVIDELIIRDIFKNINPISGAWIVWDGSQYFVDYYSGIITWFQYDEKKVALDRMIAGILSKIEAQMERHRGNTHILEKYIWTLDYLSWRSDKNKEIDLLFLYEKAKRKKPEFQQFFEILNRITEERSRLTSRST